MRVIIGFKVKSAIWLLLSMVLLLVLAGCGGSYSSNGQRIYFSAASASDEPISYSGGPGTMMQGRLACVNCHGSLGKGGKILPGPS
jgi:hypothetical protein